MESAEYDIPSTESREDITPSVDTNGFLKTSNGHALGSMTDSQVEGPDDDQASVWHKQSQPYKFPKRKGKRKTESLIAVFCQWIVEHQIGKSAYC